MLIYSQAFYGLKNKLGQLYDERESAAISHEILEFITGLNKTQRLFEKDTFLSTTQSSALDIATSKLLTGCPMQYIIGTCWFMGREFIVNNQVLIPRPETEELVEWVIKDVNEKVAISTNLQKPIAIFEVGAGSGCIALSLKGALGNAKILA